MTHLSTLLQDVIPQQLIPFVKSVTPSQCPRFPRAWRWEVEPECETPVLLFRSSARINEGFVSLDIVDVQLSMSKMSFRVAGDCQWHGVGQPNTDHERLVTLHPPPASVVDETSERRQGPQEQVVGAGPVSVKSGWTFSDRVWKTQQDTVTKQVERAEILVCLGEISAVCHAFEGSPVALGIEETLNALRDNDRRPPWPRDPSQRRSELQFLPIPWNWTRMSSSIVCEPLGGEQLEALWACATSICAHFSTVLKIVPSSSKSLRISHRSFPKKGGKNSCEAVHDEIQGCHQALPKRTLDPSRVREHRTHGAGDDRPGPKLHSSLHRSFHFLRTPINTSVGRRGGDSARNPTR